MAAAAVASKFKYIDRILGVPLGERLFFALFLPLSSVLTLLDAESAYQGGGQETHEILTHHL